MVEKTFNEKIYGIPDEELVGGAEGNWELTVPGDLLTGVDPYWNTICKPLFKKDGSIYFNPVLMRLRSRYIKERYGRRGSVYVSFEELRKLSRMFGIGNTGYLINMFNKISKPKGE